MLFLDENKQPKSQNWLYPTTARLAYELIKHKRRSIPRGAIPDIESTVLDPSQIVLDRDAKETMYTAIAMLKPGYRAMLTLFYIEGVNLKEGAEILGITPGAFANRLHRARRQLKAILLA